MNQPASKARPDKLLQPAMLARLSSLELVAKAVVDGFFTGMHRSPYFGFSQEFAEYRAYNEGDDPRLIDWNVYARTDRTYIKRFLGDTNTTINLLLDVSGSMGYQTAEVSKLDYGKFICATFAYLARKQHDAVGTILFDDDIREIMPPASHPDTLYRLLAILEKNQSSNGTQIGGSLEKLAATVTRRGILIVISDFYCEPDELTRQLQPLVQHGHDVVMFHLLDSAELSPAETDKTYRSASTLRDLETGNEMVVSPDFLRDVYPQKVASHIEALEKSAVRANVAYVPVNTAKPLDELLHKYLLLRQHRR